MNSQLRSTLIKNAVEEIVSRGNDPSHDSNHALQVLKNVEIIAEREGGDLDILVPSALFHDVVIYAKNDPRSPQAPAESAELTKSILSEMEDYPSEKIQAVMDVINGCSFNKTEEPDNIEAKILRDADKLEATGAVSVMRTFASCGQMNRRLYHPEDPFAENRDSDAKEQGLDLFYDRLLIAKDRMYTDTAKEIAEQGLRFYMRSLISLRRRLFELI